MRQLFLAFLLWFVNLTALQAQVQETFSDGDFSQAPVWQGDAAQFQVNAAGQLQSRGPAVSGTTLHLATPNQLAAGAEWEFYVQLGFATSSSNYAEVHLIADQPDLKGTGRGYFVRLGGTEDEVSLYRKDGVSAAKIINGPDQTLAGADHKLWVRVRRSPTHHWTLEVDASGTRSGYAVQGTVQDGRYTSSAFVGVLFRYSQANAHRFYFDDFTVKDVAAPALLTTKALHARAVELTFSEPLAQAEALQPNNYRLNGTLLPSQVEWQASAPHVVRLQFAQEFTAGENRLEVLRLSDQDGNVAPPQTSTFQYAPLAQRGDVKITEIYADVNPLQDLPPAEFFELYNASDKALNLQGWTYSDATAASGTFPAYVLRPGAYLIVCAAADTARYRLYGPVVGLSAFPSLNDSGDEVELFNAEGQLIDAVAYSNTWYQDNAKREGGWSLELTNVTSRCAGASQWKASGHPRGGTPGQPNSVQETDWEAPVLRQVTALSATRLVLQFSEPLDSAEARQPHLYSVSGGGAVQQVRVAAGLTEVELLLATPLQENQRYTVSVQNVVDCAGNVAPAQEQPVILPAAPQKGDVVINEILFNPRPGGVDFVEVVNRSSKYLNLQGWKLANRLAAGVANRREITRQPLLLAPGEYLVFTPDAAVLHQEYPLGRAERFVEVSALPSYPDEAGAVLVLLPNDSLMDEVRYQSSQHFRLISEAEGISLERMVLGGPSTAENFHSAATQVSATPGYENSQAQQVGVASRTLTLQPRIITPDGDGKDDALLLQFNLPQPGFVATVTIFDANGRHIRKVSANTLLGADSVLQWDGLTDAGAKAAVGYYVVLVDLFNLQGKREVLKETVVVGGRF